ncbi:MAG: sigma-54-dependent Fis family transcriptional regulator [Magnetospirillum sp.]|nr:MAG: sigma-54-dependent Fis family transcriptional regulator [Magnetospirillum sp.]
MDTAKGQPGSALRHARHLLECGKPLPAGLINATVARSWERCVDAGLFPFGQPAAADHLAARQLAMAVERRRELLVRARPVMEYLHAQTRDSGSVVILADDEGVLLEVLGDADFQRRAERAALRPGASWGEGSRGTNAIGTAVIEASPVVVHGCEHFFEHNRFLTCAAAPVTGPDGRLLGVLDISGHQRGRHPHTFGLVRTAAHMIENQLFESRHESAMRIHFHPQPGGIGTIAEGMAALSEDGRIIGANRAGLALLSMGAEDIGRADSAGTLHQRFADLLDWNRRLPNTLMVAACSGGRRLYLRIEPGRRTIATPPPPKPAERDALTDLDTGDEHIRRIIGQVRKVVNKPIPLLLQGETGVGKEVFANAVHAAGPRSDRPFVTVDCGSLPEQLIEAELFGYASGAFTGARREGSLGRVRDAHGGTLFLDEIGDMPLALQSRLLRVLQSRQVSPLGGGKPVPVDFTLIAATNRSLKDDVAAGRFRADLYYRLNGLTLTLPPLRARSDLSVLVAAVIEAIEPGTAILPTAEVATAFASYAWPGNLRQLTSVLRSACALLSSGEGYIDWHHLPDEIVEDLHRPIPASPADPPVAATLRANVDSLIERMVTMNGGNLSATARCLGISRNTLYRRRGRLGTPP